MKTKLLYLFVALAVVVGFLPAALPALATTEVPTRLPMAPGAPTIINVPASYATIQAAIDAASAGDTIVVAAGTYNENLDFKGKAITVTSASGPGATIINGGGAGSVAKFVSGETGASVLDGFTLTNGTGTLVGTIDRWGGGVYSANSSNPTLSNLIITGNSMYGIGGGIGLRYASANITNSIIRGNSTGSQGGGIGALWGPPFTVSNSIIYNNNSWYGGGIMGGGGSVPNIINSTVVGNSAVNYGGGVFTDSGSPATVTNSIVRGNTAGMEGPNMGPYASHTVTYSNIQGGWAGTGNIDADPLFVNAAAGDFHLQPGSPSIDAGNNAAVPGWLTHDFEGDPRIMDGNGDGTPTVDMGADEALATVPPTVTTDNATNITANSAQLNGTLTSLGTATSVNASFQWGLTAGNYTGNTPSVSMNTIGGFSANLSGLSPNTTYHFRARAGGDGLGYGADMVFSTSTVAAAVPYEPDANTILLDHFNGTTVGTAFGPSTYQDGLPALGQAINLVNNSYVKYAFSSWSNHEGTVEMWIKPSSYGGILHLNWNDVTSDPAAGHIGHFQLNTEGKLSWGVWNGQGDGSIVGRTTIPLNEWTHIAVSWAPSGTKLYVNGVIDAFTSVNVWPAFLSTTYVYLNYWGGNGLGYVDELRISKVARAEFITLGIPPTVVTDNATNITANSAILHGTLTSKGTAATVSASFVWGVNADNYTALAAPTPMNTTGSFSAAISSLSANTTYHFRARAVGDGAGYGGDMSFTTTAAPAVPVAYWTFDNDTTNDTVGSNHGTIVGSGVTFTTGKVGRAISFSGSSLNMQISNQYVEIPSLNLPAITVEAWVNSSHFGYYTSMVTKSYYPDAWNSPWNVWSLWFSENTANPGFSPFVASPDPAALGQWIHLAGTHDGVTAKLYVNGVEKASVPVSGPLPSTSGKVYIGPPKAANHGYQGLIDEVAIWDRALSATDIQQHYQNGLNGQGYLPPAAVPPTVSSDNAMNITPNSVRLNGTLVSLGSAPSANVSFEWGTSPVSYGFETVPVSMNTTGPFSFDLTGLSTNTTYHFRAKAVGDGTSYGTDVAFIATAPPPPPHPPEMQWQKTFGGANDDYGRSVRPTADGGYIIASGTNSTAAGFWDVYLIKTDASGNMTWSQTFGGPYEDDGYSVQPTADGGYIIAGDTTSFGAGYSDVYLIKTDASGNMTWQKTFGGANEDDGRSIQETTDGGYIIAGSTGSFGAGLYDVYLIKTDASGNMTWQKTFGGASDDWGYSVQTTADGGYIITGDTQSFGAGSNDVYLIKTDASGNMTWQKTFGGANLDLGRSVHPTADGGYIVAGYTNSFGAGYYDVYLIKSDASGNMTWSQTFGGASNEGGESVQPTADGGYIIAGGTNSFGAGLSDVYLIKLGVPQAMAMPDLIVAEKHEEWVVPGVSYRVFFTVANIGTANASAHYVALRLDGNIIEQHEVPVVLAPWEHYIGSFTTVITLSGSWDDVVLTADFQKEVVELDEFNNTLGNTVAWPPAPDLAIREKGEDWLQEGSLYQVWFVVRNRGNAPASANHSVALSIDGAQVETRAIPYVLLPGEHYWDAFYYTANLTDGVDKVKVTADINSEVAESNENNNFRDNTIAWPPAPDLIVSHKSEQWVEGQSGNYTVSFTVSNIGNDVAPAGHHVELKVDGVFAEMMAIPVDLPPGTRYLDAFAAVVTLSGSSDNITLTADMHNDVIESDETNNSRTNTWLLGGTISGRVYQSDNTTPIAGARVSVFDYASLSGTWVSYGGATTAADGSYLVRGLPTGTHGVWVRAAGYANEWYDNVYYRAQATAVSVTAPNDTPNINFSLELGGSISGRAAQSDNITPIANLAIRAYDAVSGLYLAPSVYTDLSGNYTISGMPGGSYKVRTVASITGLSYADEWYNNKKSQSEADIVVVTVPSDTPNINFSLEMGRPDLTIVEKHEVWVVEGISYTVGFTIKNQGSAPVPAGHDMALQVDGKYSEVRPVPVSLAAGANFTDNFSTVVNLSGSYDSITVVADFHDFVDESSETNNRRGNTLAWPPAPDLNAYKWEQWVEGQSGNYTVSFRVRNLGNAEAAAGHVAALFVDGVEIERQSVPVALPPNTVHTGNFTTVVALSGGVDKVKVKADVTDSVPESNEGNNSYENTIALPAAPDLVIYTKSEQFLPGSTTHYNVFFGVRNIGNAPAPAGHHVELKVDGIMLDMMPIPVTINPGRSYYGAFATVVAISDGWDSISVTADMHNDVIESDETNNSRTNIWAGAWETVRQPTGILADVAFAGANHGWAVGSGGTILHSPDGGSTWTPQKSGTSSDLWSVSFADASNGWAVGNGGKIVRTADGGSTWTFQTSNTTQRLGSVSFVDTNNGWVVGDRNILHTSNGGSTWTVQTSNTSWNLYGVSFVDTNNGWAVGTAGPIGSGIILHTSDGGAIWTSQNIGTTYGLLEVDFVDANNGWVVGSSGTILHTADGGTTWTAQSSNTTAFLAAVDFADTSNGWAVGGSGKILRTSDGGANWTMQMSNTTANLMAIAALSSSQGWVVGESMSRLYTADSGITWMVQNQDPSRSYLITAVDFVTPLEGWAIGRGTALGKGWSTGPAVVLHTADGGTTWMSQTNGTGNAALYGISFADTYHGWAVGSSGTIRHTADGGSTWTAQTSNTTNHLRGVSFVDASNGWAVGSSGTILRTSNGGSTWIAQSSGTGNTLRGASAIDSSHAWAVGDYGTILHTADGGNTWGAQNSGVGNSLYGASFVDASNGWAVGSSGTILHTSNGGGTWVAQNSGVGNSLYGASFVDASHGWAVGSSGTVRYTSDGGNTWIGQPSGTSNYLRGISATDSNHAWAVGDYGIILRYKAELPPPSVEVSINAPARVAPGRDFRAVVKIGDVMNLNGAQYDVMFDPTVLQLVNVTAGQIGATAMPIQGFTQVSPGVYRVLQALLAPPYTVNGTGHLATLQFHVLGALGNNSTINFANGTLSGWEGEIPAAWIGGFVEVGVVPGDANGDGVVNILDLTKVVRMILLLEPETPGADANLDGMVDVLDLTKIVRMILMLD